MSGLRLGSTIGTRAATARAVDGPQRCGREEGGSQAQARVVRKAELRKPRRRNEQNCASGRDPGEQPAEGAIALAVAASRRA